MSVVNFVNVIFVGILFLSKISLAAEIYENFNSAKALGMGNAYSGLVNDHNSIFINPAGLDKVRGMHVTLLNLHLGTNSADIYTTFANALSGNYLAFIQSSYGRSIWAGFTDSMAFSMRGFTFVAFNNFNMSFDLHNPAYTNMNLSATNDYGLAVGGSLPLIPKIWRVGAAVKRVTRYGGRVPFGPGTVASLNNSFINSLVNNIGTGYGLDAGTLITIPMGMQPTISLAWHDIGQTKFIPAAGSTAPPVLDNEAVLGFSAVFDAKAMKIRPALDFKHVFQVDEPLGKRVHMGAEFEFPGGFTVRGGANQGYYTYGLSLNFSFLQLDLASYGVELGTYPGQTEDRRYIMNLTVDLSFDSGSSDDEGGSGGGKRGPAGRRGGGGGFLFQRR